jgi:GWxTD domain-containing protein
MYKYGFLFFVSLWSTGIFAQSRLNGSFDYGVFKTTLGQPYVEAYYSIFGGTFGYSANQDGTYSGELEITLIATVDGQIKWFDKYNLSTGKVAPKDTAVISLLDSRRFSVPEGKFRFDMIIRDKQAPETNFIEYADSIQVYFPNGKPQVSTPVLVNKYQVSREENVFTKSGLDIYPNTTGFFAGEDSVMAFYTELYNTEDFFGEGERFLLFHQLKNYDTGAEVLSSQGLNVLQVKPVCGGVFPISLKNVPPGNYLLEVELRNKLNEPVTKVQRLLQRGGKVNELLVEDLSQVGTDFMAFVENSDSLAEFIRCLNPISPAKEQTFAKNVIRSGDKEMMKKYIVSFWMRRNPAEPQKEWLKYKAQVILAQRLFGAQYLKAYNTDRGRVFLQYGPPNVRSERPNEPFAWPYEIWQYYELYNPISEMRQTNRTFVFWNRNAASNNYELLHSDAIMEQKNDRWEMVLYNRGKGTTDIDQTSPGDFQGGWSRDIFVNPR